MLLGSSALSGACSADTPTAHCCGEPRSDAGQHHAAWRLQASPPPPCRPPAHAQPYARAATCREEAARSCAVLSDPGGAAVVSRKRCAAACGVPRLSSLKPTNMGATITLAFSSPLQGGQARRGNTQHVRSRNAAERHQLTRNLRPHAASKPTGRHGCRAMQPGLRKAGA